MAKRVRGRASACKRFDHRPGDATGRRTLPCRVPLHRAAPGWRGVAVFRIAATSLISTRNVDRPRAKLSDAPMRVKMRSTNGSRACVGGHERAHLRHDHDQRGLPQISGLAAHVRSGDQQQRVRSCRRDRHRWARSARHALQQLLDHRMPPAGNQQFAALAGLLFGEFRPRVISAPRRGARNSPARPAAPLHAAVRRRRGACRGDLLAQFGVEAALDFQDALVGVEHFALVFFQFG